MKTTIYPSKIYFLALLLLTVLFGKAQQSFGQQFIYGNEWINYNQKYYKIKVPATGIYRLDHGYLQAAGISGVDPRNFQLYRRGKEVSIHVSGEADGSFDTGDFIEFYGEHNDGALDRELYKNPDADHINTYYSLYTDTAAYFLTWSAAPGKRMDTYAQDPASLNPEPWHWQENFFFDNGLYSRGRRFGENYMSWMDAGEGFTGGLTAGWTFTLPNMVTNPHAGGPSPKLEVAIFGVGDANDVDVFIKPPTGAERLVGTIQLADHESKKQVFTIAHTDFASDGRLIVRVTARKSTNGYRAFYFKTIYPQRNVISTNKLPFVNASPSPSPLSYLFEGSTAANAIAYDITSVDNIKRIQGTVNGAHKGFVFPPSFSKAILWSGANLVPPAAHEVKFRNLAGNKANYLIISHKVLMQPTSSSTNPIKDYASYRASGVGGGYDTLVMDVDLIYNQFFFGDKSAAALRRYMKYMMANGKPEYLLLLGKGLEADNVNVRKNPNSLAYKDLVPTGGTPGSDIFFTADWEKGNYAPKVATGRVPANTAAEVLAYLDKVKTHEALPQNLDWRKNILHLIGSHGSEQNTILSYMRSYERIIEDKWLGANVKSVIRSSTGGLETVNIARELNNGLSLITFFGHSSGTVSDLDIGRVSDVVNGYNNENKYPMLLMNGCNAGNIFTTQRSFGEDWLLTPNKGTIGFLAHVSYGYPSLMNVYSSNFYTTAFANEEYLLKPIGIQHKRAIELTEQKVKGDNAIAMNMQMILQADPALHVIAPDKADYTVTDGGLSLHSLDGSTKVTANSEKFLLKVDVRNLGKVNDKPFQISVTRKLENGTSIEYDPQEVQAVYYRDTVELELEAKTTNGFGVNVFEVKLDPNNDIEELEENNNTATLEYFFSKSGVLAIGPKEYSIISENKVKLIGHSTDLLVGRRGYYFEIDTVYTFNSPWKKINVVQADLMPEWEVTLPESGVYFWRLRYETAAAGEELVWASSSFRYIPNSQPGWSQKGIGQLQKAVKQSLIDDPEKEELSFSPMYRIFELKGVGGGGTFGYPPYGIFLDNFKTIEADCAGRSANFMAIVLNDKTLEPFLGMPAGLGRICGTEPKFVYHFGNLTTAADRTKLEEFLRAIPEGYHVAMLSMYNVPFTTFPESLKEAFRNIGSSLIDKLKTGEPFAIVGRKGSVPGTAVEVGPSDTDPTPANLQTISMEKEVISKVGQGTLTSSLIGPANKWQSLQLQLDLEDSDSYQLDIVGVNNNQEEIVLWRDVKATDFDISSVNATTFPYLKLKLILKDEVQRSAPKLNYWTVLFEGVPEGLMRPDLVGLDKYQLETLSEQATNGQLNLQFAFHNISSNSFNDSLTVEAVVFLENGGKEQKSFKVKPLQKEELLYFTHAFSTLKMKGNNRLRVTVNPRGIPETLPEQNYLNNVLEVPFTVGQYVGMPPTLDIVFDGNRILDGDIVSPRPVINMVLKDNTNKIPITDPASVKVYLKKEGGDFEEINVSSDSRVKWFPADDKNDFRVEYQPQLEDGEYTLEVQGEDALGQRAGTERFSINFKVINESSITNFYPYPNPFSSKTRFVFTLTGTTVPENMRLQIMTVTGKVIREIQKQELGPIKIGNNVTEFAWDGTDEFGDRLANGVYLYRVIMDNGQDEMKHRSTKGDKAFQKEYGKVYILR
ncbi:putative type IX secretion system sortase PorU2 [Rufibacter roseus]|uniref:C25 family cysteine peptidase n=1 Tax=Rufibacter roseus TaxID=1567108 RepID=A0ABW2DQN4_9BACT|nr:C25 family cysteine peptidase [Rufibacter roseus]